MRVATVKICGSLEQFVWLNKGLVRLSELNGFLQSQVLRVQPYPMTRELVPRKE